MEHVQPESPAVAAGISQGDVLETLGGKTVRSMDDVSAILGAHKPGDVIDAEVSSGGITRGLKATLADRPAALPSE